MTVRHIFIPDILFNLEFPLYCITRDSEACVYTKGRVGARSEVEESSDEPHEG